MATNDEAMNDAVKRKEPEPEEKKHVLYMRL